jgi:hypothetical protein
MVSGLSVINHPQAEPGVTTKQREVRCVQDSRDRQVPHPKPALVVHFEFQLGEMVCTLCFFNNGNFTCSGHPGSTFTFSDCHLHTARRPPTFAWSSVSSTETYPIAGWSSWGSCILFSYILNLKPDRAIDKLPNEPTNWKDSLEYGSYTDIAVVFQRSNWQTNNFKFPYIYIIIYCWLHSRDLKLELSCQHNTIWPTCLPWHPSFFTLSLATCILLCSKMFSSEESLQRHDLPSFAWSQPRQSIATETVWSDWEPLEESRKIGLCLMGINHDDPWYSMVLDLLHCGDRLRFSLRPTWDCWKQPKRALCLGKFGTAAD